MAINASRLGAIVLILFSAFFFYLAGTYPPDAALFPRALFLGLIILSVTLIVRSYQFAPYKPNLAMNQKFQVVVCAFLAVAYVSSMHYIGYYAASAIFILLLAAFLRFQSKIVPAIVAVAFPLTIFVVFEVLLNIPVPSVGS